MLKMPVPAKDCQPLTGCTHPNQLQIQRHCNIFHGWLGVGVRPHETCRHRSSAIWHLQEAFRVVKEEVSLPPLQYLHNMCQAILQKIKQRRKDYIQPREPPNHSQDSLAQTTHQTMASPHGLHQLLWQVMSYQSLPLQQRNQQPP